MSSTKDKPRGLTPVKNGNGSPWNGECRAYLATSSAKEIGVGDVVVLEGTAGARGTVVDGIDVGGMASVAKMTVSTQIPVGVVVGLQPKQTDLSSTYKPASVDSRVVYVVDDPFAMFMVQEDGASENIQNVDVGNNYSLTYTTVNTLTGRSTVEIDSSELGTTTAYDVKVVELYRTPENYIATASTEGINTEWVVKFAKHSYLNNSGI